MWCTDGSGVMLGLLWRLYATCRDSPAMAQHAQTLLELISKEKVVAKSEATRSP